jgi:hypothetical protein
MTNDTSQLILWAALIADSDRLEVRHWHKADDLPLNFIQRRLEPQPTLRPSPTRNDVCYIVAIAGSGHR